MARTLRIEFNVRTQCENFKKFEIRPSSADTHEWPAMKQIFWSVATLFTCVGLAVFAFMNHQKGDIWVVGSVLIGIVVLLVAFIKGILSNVGSALFMFLCAGGTFWSGSEFIQSIDFNKPFLMSFYWSTVGYFFLTLLLLFFTAGGFYGAADEPGSS